ncbi:MAG TPA: hypothetical protein VD704_08390 [Gaiellaceae bacterium]|nr:hypothetical protein [Gaiellaceae bacterium]
MTAPDGTKWTVATRREPRGEEGEPDAAEAERKRFWDGPQGWLLSLVAIAGLVALSFVSPIAAVVLAASLAVAELVDGAWKRLRRPWLVEASSDGLQHDRAWRVAGPLRARRAAGEVARALERGYADWDPPDATRL